MAGQTYTNAVAAKEKADTAVASAGTASSAANTATSAATLAESWATSTAVVSGGLYGARYYAQQAQTLIGGYKGALSSDPLSAVAGDWYISTTSGFVRAYNGTSWVNGISAVAGVSSVNGLTGAVTLDIGDIQDLQTTLDSKQPTLVSGTNIKTLNGTTLLGSGNYELPVGGGVSNNEVAATGLIRRPNHQMLTMPSGSGTNCLAVGWHVLDSDRRLLVVSNAFAGLYAVVFTVSTNSFGSLVLIRSTPGSNLSNGALSLLIGTDKVLVVSCESSALQSVILTVAGTVVTVNAVASASLPYAIDTSHGFGPGNAYRGGIITCGSSYVVAGTTAGGVFCAAMTVSGTTVAVGSPQHVLFGDTTGRPHLISTGSNAVLVNDRNGGVGAFYPLTVSGASITVGTSVAFPFSTLIQMACTRLPSGNIAVIGIKSGAYSSFAAIFNVTTLTVSYVTVTEDCTVLTGIQAIGNQVLFTSRNYAHVLTDNAGTAVLGTSLLLPTGDMGGLSSSFGTLLGVDNTSVLVAGGLTVAKVGISGNNPVLLSATSLGISTTATAGPRRGINQPAGVMRRPPGLLKGATLHYPAITHQSSFSGFSAVTIALRVDNSQPVTVLAGPVYEFNGYTGSLCIHESESACMTMAPATGGSAVFISRYEVL
jgi:hypothetical protein